MIHIFDDALHFGHRSEHRFEHRFDHRFRTAVQTDQLHFLGRALTAQPPEVAEVRPNQIPHPKMMYIRLMKILQIHIKLRMADPTVARLLGPLTKDSTDRNFHGTIQDLYKTPAFLSFSGLTFSYQPSHSSKNHQFVSQGYP